MAGTEYGAGAHACACVCAPVRAYACMCVRVCAACKVYIVGPPFNANRKNIYILGLCIVCT